jgi:SAM-dependent methyltransferase
MNEYNNETLKQLIKGMRDVYARGENAMEFARNFSGSDENKIIATLLAYDLQSGSYVNRVRKFPTQNTTWCKQIQSLISPYLAANSSILEAGCGEATTLAEVLKLIENRNIEAYGFDISWSRCDKGREWLAEHDQSAKLFVGDLFNIPLDDDCIDIVYTSHSMEPNGGKETEALKELYRIAKKALIIVEPLYELATQEARERMLKHGYVTDLSGAAKKLGLNVSNFKLLDYSPNPLNPSGVMVIEKNVINDKKVSWRCPVTFERLKDNGDVLTQLETGLAYPVLREIPMLTSANMIIASGIK